MQYHTWRQRVRRFGIPTCKYKDEEIWEGKICPWQTWRKETATRTNHWLPCLWSKAKANCWQKFSSLWISLKTISLPCQLRFSVREHLCWGICPSPKPSDNVDEYLAFQSQDFCVQNKGTWNANTAEHRLPQLTSVALMLRVPCPVFTVKDLPHGQTLHFISPLHH